ncbi:MAG: adenine-specific methyltransferase EcoRI family protein [bacterium]
MTTAKNADLHLAKRAKNDEFYTNLSVINDEMNHYAKHFKGKVVYCNCDDPTASQFYYYFKEEFTSLGLKKVIAATYRNPQPGTRRAQADLIAEEQEKYAAKKTEKANKPTPTIKPKKAICIEYEGKKTGRPRIMHGDGFYHGGDFRSAESIALLKQSDIVVTNPPFSLFREYVGQLMHYNKKFLILGNPNAINYAEIFPLLKANKIWLGVKSMGTDMLFDVPQEYADELVATKKEGSAYKIIDGVVMGRTMAIWFTNLPHFKRSKGLTDMLTMAENQAQGVEYQKYDNYDAIEVASNRKNKVEHIPSDHAGVMGVPITFMDKYNPEQFEIVGQGQGNLYRQLESKGLSKQFVDDYYKGGGKGLVKEDHPLLGFYSNDGKAIIPYARILIRHKSMGQ